MFSFCWIFIESSFLFIVTYMLPATFPNGFPSFNSLILFKKLCPILATAPRTLPIASIPLMCKSKWREKNTLFRGKFIVDLVVFNFFYRSISDIWRSLPSNKSLRTRMAAAADCLPTSTWIGSCGLRDKRKNWIKKNWCSWHNEKERKIEREKFPVGIEIKFNLRDDGRFLGSTYDFGFFFSNGSGKKQSAAQNKCKRNHFYRIFGFTSWRLTIRATVWISMP